MTAFDNIKVNNWPSSTTDPFEDFCVLKLPLNDQASLTESLPVVAGSKVLFPKRTLTNNGVSALTAGPTYSDTLTVSAAHPNNTSPTAGFDGNTATSHIGGVGATATWDARTYSFPPNSTVEVYSYTSGGERSWAVDTGSGYGSEISEVAGWQNLGTYSNIQYIRNSSDAGAGYGPGFGAIRINGTVLVDAPGGAKKHYGNNAQFAKGNRISLPSQEDLIWGTRDLTFEVWVYPETDTHGALYDTGAVNTAGHTALFMDAGYMYWRAYPGADCQVAHSTSGYTTGEWQHIACVRHNGTLKIYRNGQEVASQANNSSITQGAWGIGDLNGFGPDYRFSGKMQDYRIYNIAKYTSNFTPPSAILG